MDDACFPPALAELLAARAFLLRQAGIDPRALARCPARGAARIALIDGAVDARHPALRGARIERSSVSAAPDGLLQAAGLATAAGSLGASGASGASGATGRTGTAGATSAASAMGAMATTGKTATTGTTRTSGTSGTTSATKPTASDTPEDVASRHATFCASILVGNAATGAVGLCQGATLINAAMVTPAMLDGSASPREVDAALTAAVAEAMRLRCRTLLFGVEIRSPQSAHWRGLREAISAARAEGIVVVLPAGNRPGHGLAAACRWDEALVVASLTARGEPSSFSTAAGPGAGAVFAPGEQVPGAEWGDEVVPRSGSSFAAALVAGALALADAIAPDRDAARRVARLFSAGHRRLDAGALFSPPVRSGFVVGTAFNAFRESPHAPTLH